MKTKIITQLVWNGCDGYDVSSLDVFKGSKHHKPFAVMQVDDADIPIIDGEECYDGLFLASDGNTYKAVQP